MQITYTVHSAAAVPVEITADFNGVAIPATVDGFIVELVADNGTATHTLKAMPGADKDFLEANFPVGAKVIGTFAVAV
jgi:hypothetical protein